MSALAVVNRSSSGRPSWPSADRRARTSHRQQRKASRSHRTGFFSGGCATVGPYVNFLNGSYGVGKSSTLDHLGDLLAECGQPFSLTDVDWYHRSWPPAQGDPENVVTEAANMAAVWSNYRRTGTRQLIVAGVITSTIDRNRYEEVFDLPVRIVRLVAGPAVTEGRLRRRYTRHQHLALTWHLERHSALHEQLARTDLDELVVDTDERDPRSVAVEVAEHFKLCRSLRGQRSADRRAEHVSRPSYRTRRSRVLASR